MKRLNRRLIVTPGTEGLQSSESHDAEEHISAYRAPQLLVIGRAVDLVQRSSSGHLIDGNGGWWVWGS